MRGVQLRALPLIVPQLKTAPRLTYARFIVGFSLIRDSRITGHVTAD